MIREKYMQTLESIRFDLENVQRKLKRLENETDFKES